MKSNFRLIFPLARAQVRQSTVVSTCQYSNAPTEIKIPKRIKRGPTDILKALSSTVGVDPTAAHYKYHDDPYLIPYSNPSKRSYALSQEAGRKAAQWVKQQHADLFQHKVADPVIEAYAPKVEYKEEQNVSEDVLQKLIATQQVSDAMTVYQFLRKRQIQVSLDTKQRMLELLCFYNLQDPLSDEWVEEKWFQSRMISKNEYFKKTWKDDGFAEALFEDVVQSGGDLSKAHCALISGMLTHGQSDRGWKLFEEAKQKGLELNVIVYNALICRASGLRESHDMIWQLAVDLLNEMNSCGIRPNLDTLNSMLLTLEYSAQNRNARVNALGVIAEFKKLGIQPSLASYAHLVRIFSRDKAQISGVIRNVLDHLEKDESFATPRNLNDNKFFMRAMETINELNDRDLAMRLDNLLHRVKNYSLIGNSFSESIYYRNYFRLMLNTSDIDVFMDFYYKFVPNIYVPEISVLLEILNMVEAQAGWKYLPKLWGDLIMFEQLRGEGLNRLMSLAVQAAAEDETTADDMAAIGWSVWEKIEGGGVRGLEWTGELLGDVLNLLSTAKHLSKAHIVFHQIDRLQNNVTGEPSVASLEKYVDACLETKNVDGALKCVKYCDNRNLLETEKFLKKITNCGIKLEAPQERVVTELQKKM